jgi:hypothetical protein
MFGIIVSLINNNAASATLNRITANNNQFGVSANRFTTIANSVLSNNNSAWLAAPDAPGGSQSR